MSIWVNELYRSKTIYEKRFPKGEMPDIEVPADTKTEHLTFDEIIERFYKDMVYVVIPGREKKAIAFMRKAAAVSELYEIDMKIEEHLSHICVTYYFDCACLFK